MSPSAIIEHCSIITLYSQRLAIQAIGTHAAVKIHQRQVIDVALALLDEHGLAELQMRAVASRLNVQASALYWHVRNKGELLSLMSWDFYDGALSAIPAGLTWRDWLLTYGVTFRKGLLGHRDSAQLCAIARPLDDDTDA